jgi:archaellum component FlaF (FlaF/FlaG flagellin family)
MAQTANIPTPFRLQKFGASASGSVTKVTLLTFTIPAATTDGYSDGIGNQSKIVHFGATVASGGVNSLFQLEISNDGVTFIEVQRIDIADNRTDVVSLSNQAPQWILAGQTARVSLTQGTAARAAAWTYGNCAKKDISDI